MKKNFLRLMALLAVLSLFAAACGNDSDDEGAGDDSAVAADTDGEAADTDGEAADTDGEVADTDGEMTEDDGEMTEMADIVDTAVASGEFPTLVAALEAADLVDALKGEGPFTVFAPTEDAFAAALDALGLTAEELLASPDLEAILLYHVVPGKNMAETVVTLDGAEVETLNGAAVTVTIDGESVMVNDATVVQTDIEASNGVIHVIDTVLLPPQ